MAGTPPPTWYAGRRTNAWGPASLSHPSTPTARSPTAWTAPAARPPPAAPAAVPYLPGTPGTPATNPPAATPYLTPAQQDAFNRMEYSYTYGSAALGRQLSNDEYNHQVEQAAAIRSSAFQSRSSVNNTAGRNLAFSSIAANDLTDIATTLSIRNSILDTRLATARIDIAARQAGLDTMHTMNENTYNTLRVQNAQAIPPVLPTPATPGTPATPARPIPPPPTPYVEHPPPGDRPPTPGLPNPPTPRPVTVTGGPNPSRGVGQDTVRNPSAGPRDPRA